MGFENRDYNREAFGMSGGFGSGGFGGGGGGGLGGRLSGASITTWLLIINAVVYLLDAMLAGASRSGGFTISKWGALNLDTAVYGFQIWRFLTFQFLHADFFHVLFNCIGLFFFGPLVEQWWGSRRFLAFYLTCGVTAGVMYALIAGLLPGVIFPAEAVQAGAHNVIPLVGASGGLFGILIGAALLFPNLKVMLLIPPVPMTMRTMALIFLGIAFFSILIGGRNAGGQVAHLGGAAMGYVLIRYPGFIAWADRLNAGSRRGGPSLKQRVQKVQQQRASQQRMKDQQEVDRILAKVRDHGLHSLTQSEQRTLQRETQRQQRGGR